MHIWFSEVATWLAKQLRYILQSNIVKYCMAESVIRMMRSETLVSLHEKR